MFVCKLAAKQVLLNQPGIRRMPDKIFRQADQLRKQQQQQQPKTQQAVGPAKAKPRSATPTATQPKEPPTATKSADKREEESLNLEQGLSDSLVEALYCGTVKPATMTNGQPAASVGTATYTPSGHSTTPDDSSILKVSSTDDDASILPSTKDSEGEQQHGLTTESPFKGISLKDFEQHRKIIEEQNKQKKQMLYKAIEQHTQKTAAESRKIEEIRHELSKLESDLAVDVALLRKQIDAACIHFANVE